MITPAQKLQYAVAALAAVGSLPMAAAGLSAAPTRHGPSTATVNTCLECGAAHSSGRSFCSSDCAGKFNLRKRLANRAKKS